MEVVDFFKTNSVMNQYMAELRDKNYQKNRLLFRHNIRRVGQMMAYELSKTDPMLATGGSMAASIEALTQTGRPRHIHVCCVVATPESIEVVKQALPDNATIWCAAIDPGMNAQKYIVPGFGDCGDLCYGEKL